MSIRLNPLPVAALLAVLGVLPGTALAERDGADGVADRPFYLNILTRQANAEFAVGRYCQRGRLHKWGERDASDSIRQWLHDDADVASHRICIRLDDRVAEVRITPIGGHCGHEFAAAMEPDDGAVLRRPWRGSVTVSGCHASISDLLSDELALRFGGVAFRFADGFGLGDSYVAGTFYGVYDAFGDDGLSPFNEPVFKIAEYNTHLFDVDVLDGRGRPWWPEIDDDSGGR